MSERSANKSQLVVITIPDDDPPGKKREGARKILRILVDEGCKAALCETHALQYPHLHSAESGQARSHDCVCCVADLKPDEDLATI